MPDKCAHDSCTAYCIVSLSGSSSAYCIGSTEPCSKSMISVPPPSSFCVNPPAMPFMTPKAVPPWQASQPSTAQARSDDREADREAAEQHNIATAIAWGQVPPRALGALPPIAPAQPPPPPLKQTSKAKPPQPPPPPPPRMQKRSKAPPQKAPPQQSAWQKRSKAPPQKARPCTRFSPPCPKTEKTNRFWIKGECSACHAYDWIAKGFAKGHADAWELLEIVAYSSSLLFCGPCLAEDKAGIRLEHFPPDLHDYRKRSRHDDMEDYPEWHGNSKLHDVNYVFPYKPHKKMRNDEVPSHVRCLKAVKDGAYQALEAVADKAVEDVNWICDVDHEEHLNDGWMYSQPEDRSHRDISFEIHSG